MAHLQPCGCAYVIETLNQERHQLDLQCASVVSGSKQWKQLKSPHLKLRCGSAKQLESSLEGSKHSKKQSAKAMSPSTFSHIMGSPYPKFVVKENHKSPPQVDHSSCPLPLSPIRQSFRRSFSQFSQPFFLFKLFPCHVSAAVIYGSGLFRDKQLWDKRERRSPLT